MNLTNFDLNLFIVFDAIYTERNLTRAGQVIGITQPAVSNSLARLRDAFDDQLFLRSAQGMMPTPFAQTIISDVRDAIKLLRGSLDRQEQFDPETAEMAFRISMTDRMSFGLLPALYQMMAERAPRMTLLHYQVKRRDIVKELATGSIDIVIDPPLTHDPMLKNEKIADGRYALGVSSLHPLADRESITLDEFTDLGFIEVSSRRNGLTPIDLELGKLGRTRNIVVRTQHYLPVKRVLNRSQLAIVATDSDIELMGLVKIELPVSVPALEAHMYWHESAQQSPANAWFRDLVRDAINAPM